MMAAFKAVEWRFSVVVFLVLDLFLYSFAAQNGMLCFLKV
jgi:hypothetical protein